MPTNLVRCGNGGLTSILILAVTAILTPGVAAADTQAPAVPTNLHVQNASSFTSATFQWTPSSDDSGWVMYEVEANALPRSLVRLGATTPSKTVTGLTPGLTYTVSVTAMDGSRNTSTPATIQFTTPVDNTPPTTPDALQAVTVNGFVDSIRWDAATDASTVQYVLRSSGNRIFGTRDTRVTAFDLLYLDCVVQPGSTHTLTVEALDAQNNVSGRSRPLTVTFPTID